MQDGDTPGRQGDLLHCEHCLNDTRYAAESLSQLVPSDCPFDYDVLVLVGQALFLCHRRAEETIQAFRGRRVRLSPSEVGYLAKKFVVYLALAHRQSASCLKQAMRPQCGYILHLDGTGEGGGPMLMSRLDSLSGIVLGNVKVPQEQTERIVPFLQEIKRRFGVPVAASMTWATAFWRQSRWCFPASRTLSVIFIFLRDVGKDLLEVDQDAIRQRLRRHGLTERLLYYARRFKAIIDQQPGLVESFCQNVRGHFLPSEKLEVVPLLCAYALIQWALEGNWRNGACSVRKSSRRAHSGRASAR